MDVSELNTALELPHRATALPEMATGVVILDENGRVEFVNASAANLFVSVDPVGCTMPALLASCGARGGEEAFATLRADTEHLIRFGDGRLMEGAIRHLSSGGTVVSLDDVTSHVRTAELARRDALTGLCSRAAFREQLASRLDTARSNAEQIAILYVDLDHFKAVNDTLGHPVGDALLRKVAERFRNATRGEDIIGRLGGDEFAIIQASGAQPDAAKALAMRLVDLIGRAYVIEGHIVHIGASVGIALSGKSGADPDTLIKQADLALYRAKEDGRGRFRMFEPAMVDRVEARRLTEIDLRRALALRQFALVYQPQIDVASGDIVGCEALIRWNHPTRGLISPVEFIPIAEEIGVISAIGDWVLRTACKAAAAWPVAVPIAVNLSAFQFRTGNLAQTVVAALVQADLPSHRLELEVTESALIDESAAVLDVLENLRSLGVKIAMDDFGTGYSALNYLLKFPFDKIKIDRSFVQDLDTRADKRAVVRAIASLATDLGMQTIAEGVETEAEFACIKADGCSHVQGYLTGRPVPESEIVTLLKSQETSSCRDPFPASFTTAVTA